MNWTEEEVEYLEKAWGRSDVKYISKKINRSVGAITQKAYKIGLPRYFESGDYITLNQFFRYFKGANINSYYNISYIQNLGMPISHKKNGNKNVRIIKIEDFWKWAEKNKVKIDFSVFPKGTFGIEPDWVEKLRNRDKINKLYVNKNKWTKYEDNMLIDLLKTYHYTTDMLAERLGRTEGAIIRRISDLGTPYRPLRNSPHTKWTNDETSKLKSLISDGYNYTYIGRQISRHSVKAIQGLVYRLYGTENLDKARGVLINEQLSAVSNENK